MSELKHQLYGGEVSDYISSSLYEQRSFEDPQTTDKNIGEIYSAQVQGKKSIDTTGIYSSQSLTPKFERDPMSDKLEAQLNQTLQHIAQQLGLNNKNDANVDSTLSLKSQSEQDIEAANRNVLQAMKELAELKAI